MKNKPDEAAACFADGYGRIKADNSEGTMKKDRQTLPRAPQSAPDRQNRKENPRHTERSRTEKADAPRRERRRGSALYAGGRNSAAEAVRAGLVKKLYVKTGRKDERLAALMAEAASAGLPVEEKDEAALSRMVPELVHQGVVAELAPYRYADLEEVLARWEGRDPFLILLDGLEDVRNLGAIIRTAECAGAAAVLLPEHRSCEVTYAAMKTAAGACAYMPVCRIGNISRTLEALKARGFWVVGTDMDGESLYSGANLRGPLVIVMGAEGTGMARLTRKACDFCVRIPMKGRVSSLNVSVAAALLMYEAARQREA